MTDTTRRATLIISAKDEASQQVGSTALKFTELNSAIELGKKAVEAFKAVYDFAKEGAAIERIGAQWEKTADEFSFNAKKIASAMSEAADRTVDDEALMQAANRALTQGVIQDADQLVKFVEIARASAVRFGGDAAQAFEQILRGTEYGAQRMLKATVGVVDFSKAYDDLALRLGKRKQDLTDEEQMQARVNAVLETGQSLVDKVGDTSKDASTSFEQFETGINELGDSVKAFVSSALGPLVRGLADMVSPATEVKDRIAQIERELAQYSSVAVGSEGATYALKNELARLREEQERQAKVTAAQSIPAMDDLDRSTTRLMHSTELLDEGMHDGGLSAIAFTNYLNGLTLEERKAADAAKEIVNAEVKKSWDDYYKLLDDAKKATTAFRIEQGNLAESLMNAKPSQVAAAAIRNIQQAMEAGNVGSERGAELIKDLQLKYGLATKESQGMAQGLDLIDKALKSGLISTIPEYEKALAKLKQASRDGVVTSAELGIAEVKTQGEHMMSARNTALLELETLNNTANTKISDASSKLDVQAKDKFDKVESYYNHLKSVSLDPIEFKVFVSLFGGQPIPPPPPDAHDRNRARGGPVMAGHQYMVGEDGPETLVMGSSGGYVIPMAGNHSGGGKGGTVINLNYYGPLPGNPVSDVGMLQALAGGG